MRNLAVIAAAILAAAPVSAQPQASVAPDYSKDSSWLCLPGRGDTCSTPLATTALNPNGYGSSGLSAVAKDPPLDCFYVYPTVSNDQGMNSDVNAGREEKLAAEAQFARFASVCRTFAPIYRQMTVAAVAAYSAGANIDQAAALAYRDVAAAWRYYLRTRNAGRPFVLDRAQPGQPDAADADRARDRERPGCRGAHEARDHSRLRRARAAGQARRRDIQEDAVVQSRRARRIA